MRPRAELTRRVLLRALLAAGGISPGLLFAARAASKKPVAQGVRELTGDVRINGRPAQLGQIVHPGDTVTTGPDSGTTIVIDPHAFLLRENSELEFTPDLLEDDSSGVSGSLKLAHCAMLAVFGRNKGVRINTPAATVGIRGTACYIDARPARTYACICYGRAELAAAASGELLETVDTKHHESPRYIYPAGAPRAIEPAPVIDHSDAELRLLEALFERVPPFDSGDGKKTY